MTRTAVLSDVHGNLEALVAVFRDLDRRGVRDVVCLGDVVGYGANPRECVLAVMERCRFTLLGNHEQAAMYYAEDFNPKARAAIDWTRWALNSREAPREENWKIWGFLGDLPETLRENGALFVHGSPRDPVHEYVMPRDARNEAKRRALFEALDRPVGFCGHSHFPGVLTPDGGFLRPADLEGRHRFAPGSKAIVNVGSVGQPRDGDPRLCFALWDSESVEFVRLAYDCESAAKKIRASGALPAYLADRLIVGH